MPLPYMGSKRKSASRISNVIEAYCPNNAKILVELFTGWFAVWEEFLKKWYKIIANDKNKYVIALLQKVIKEKLDEKKCLEWVSKKKFNDVIKNPDRYDDWYVWYVGIIWSFGNNNNKWYLFWPEIEEKKRSLYDFVVNKKIDEFIKKNIPKKYIEWALRLPDLSKRRMALRKVLRALRNKPDLQSLERLQSLQSLQRLQSLEKNVEFLSSSYEEVEIPNNAIVYCDPPYQWTAEYAEGNFNHPKFWEYIRKISKTNKVFVSEYTAPEDFKCIYEFSQKSSLAWWSQPHNNQPNEKIFIFSENTV